MSIWGGVKWPFFNFIIFVRRNPQSMVNRLVNARDFDGVFDGFAGSFIGGFPKNMATLDASSEH